MNYGYMSFLRSRVPHDAGYVLKKFNPTRFSTWAPGICVHFSIASNSAPAGQLKSNDSLHKSFFQNVYLYCRKFALMYTQAGLLYYFENSCDFHINFRSIVLLVFTKRRKLLNFAYQIIKLKRYRFMIFYLLQFYCY